MPAPKKHSSTRARANKATTAATLSTIRRGRRPQLPSGPDWHPQVSEWWADVWASPMAPEWHKSDTHNVIYCAMLLQDFWTAPSAKDRKDAIAEYRLQRKDLGLTPYDRRRLEWTIETAEESKDRGQARRQRGGAKQPAAATDPRLALVQ